MYVTSALRRAAPGSVEEHKGGAGGVEGLGVEGLGGEHGRAGALDEGGEHELLHGEHRDGDVGLCDSYVKRRGGSLLPKFTTR